MHRTTARVSYRSASLDDTPRRRLAVLLAALVPSIALAISLTACSDDSSTTPGDSTPPAAVSNLAATADGPGAVILTWTAPGDDGTEGRAEGYDIRSSRDPITQATWDSVSLVAAGRPAEPGTPESRRFQGLASGIRYYALKTVDDSGNQSSISNVASVEVPGIAPPAAITDLAVVSEGDREVALTWTAPTPSGDDPATAYDLRYSTETLNDSNFADAMAVSNLPTPSDAGTAETFVVTGLEAATTYYFALRSAVQEPNWSELSNLVDGTTANIVRLTTSTGIPGCLAPAWSPDGTRILYSFDDSGEPPFQRLRWIPSTGGSTVQLTTGATTAHSPSWSPDGSEIAFQLERFENKGQGTVSYFELAVMPAEPNGVPTVLAAHGDTVSVQSSTWSPDGSAIAYSVSYFPSPESEVYVIPRSGGERRLLLAGTTGVRGRTHWSPNGDVIAFSTRAGDLWTIPAEGGIPTRLTNTPEESESGPAWSPDGSRIAFGSNPAGNYDIWVMDVDGTNRIQLTSDSEDEYLPSWSPDGTAIAFQRGFPADIWIVYLE
ncbi:MAG: PD40 domain-containing protein [Candidatus Eisenbacteria bacterium]|uniref:PD40 domain-containing protein n=1 Tax=Eiseniibacteriota bacterium TaxID=2212470 RepID=A0A956NHD9_UNCEI|nr:PD40 domain-containing protein [Candidatus Eisenbacteria bacterium]